MRPAPESEGSIENTQPSITIKVNVLMDGFSHTRPGVLFVLNAQRDGEREQSGWWCVGGGVDLI